MKFNITNNEDKKLPIKYLESMDVQSKWLVEIKKPTRSSLQNRALHLYFNQLANYFNEVGFEHTYTGLKGMEISSQWTEQTIKEVFWKGIQRSMYNIESTTKLTTEQINVIYDAINKAISIRFGKHLPFPSQFSNYEEEVIKNGEKNQKEFLQKLKNEH